MRITTSYDSPEKRFYERSQIIEIAGRAVKRFTQKKPPLHRKKLDAYLGEQNALGGKWGGGKPDMGT